MGWLISGLLALLIASLLALAMPAIFGPIVAGAAPLLIVIALLGLGAVWWRHSRNRVDATVSDGPAHDDRRGGEEDPVET